MLTFVAGLALAAACPETQADITRRHASARPLQQRGRLAQHVIRAFAVRVRDVAGVVGVPDQVDLLALVDALHRVPGRPGEGERDPAVVGKQSDVGFRAAHRADASRHGRREDGQQSGEASLDGFDVDHVRIGDADPGVGRVCVIDLDRQHRAAREPGQRGGIRRCGRRSCGDARARRPGIRRLGRAATDEKRADAMPVPNARREIGLTAPDLTVRAAEVEEFARRIPVAGECESMTP